MGCVGVRLPRIGLLLPHGALWRPALGRGLSALAFFFVFVGLLPGIPQILAPAAEAAVHYVDSRGGDDSCDGLAPERAWKTIARVNQAALKPGDEVLFRRGSVWREALTPRSSGRPGRPIVYGTYGPGEGRPVILGSVDAGGEEGWTETSPGIWAREGLAWRTNSFGLVQAGLWRDGVGARQVAGRDDLAAPWDFAVDPERGRVLVRLDHNPGRHRVEIQQRNGVGFSSADHVEIRGLEIAYCGMGVAIWEGEGWSLVDLVVRDVVEDGIHANGSEADAPHRGKVRGCRIENWAWKSVARPIHDYADWKSNEPFMGYGLHVFHGEGWEVVGNDFAATAVTTGTDASAICFDNGSHAAAIRNNRIDLGDRLGGPTMGILLWATRSSGPSDVAIEDNLLRNLGGAAISVHNFRRYGFQGLVDIRGNVVVGACALDPPDAEIVRVWTDFPGSGPVNVEGNVLVGSPPGKNPHPAVRVRASSDVFVARNVMVRADSALVVEMGAVVVAEGNLASDIRGPGSLAKAGGLRSEGNCWGAPGPGCAGPLDVVSDPRLVLDLGRGVVSLPEDSPCAEIAAQGPLADGPLRLWP